METTKGLATGTALQEIFGISERFDELTKWVEDDYIAFEILLNVLKVSRDGKNKNDFGTTKSIGDALEDVVNFIIKKTFFFTVSTNVRTGTNEIDQVIRLSKHGKIALEHYGITKSLLNIEDEIFLGECKNYADPIGVTYIGKFYALLKKSDCDLGLLFTYHGVSGDEKKWSDGHGLMKVLKLIEKYSGGRDFNILEFNIEDYEQILQGVSFFDLIRAKKAALTVAANHKVFLENDIPDELQTIVQNAKIR